MNRHDQDFLRDIGFRIREKRQAMGLSQEDLGEKADLHRTYIGAIERGERNISILNLRQIAKSLRIPIAQLMDGLA